MTFDNSNVYYIGKRRAVQNDKETLKSKANVYLEELIISYGGGSNGKSTFWNSIAGALGDYSGNISADTLTIGCKRNVKPELAEAKGKRLPKVVQEAIDKYRNDNDWMSHFLEACCELGTGLEEKSGDVYLTYRSYCTRTGEFIRSTSEFYNALELRGIRRRRTSKSKVLMGIKLLEEDAEI